MNLKGLHLSQKMKYSDCINHKSTFSNFRAAAVVLWIAFSLSNQEVAGSKPGWYIPVHDTLPKTTSPKRHFAETTQCRKFFSGATLRRKF